MTKLLELRNSAQDHGAILKSLTLTPNPPNSYANGTHCRFLFSSLFFFQHAVVLLIVDVQHFVAFVSRAFAALGDCQ